MIEILQEVLEKGKPDKKEEARITGLAKELLDKANKNGSDFKALIVGSVAKETFLKGADIDLFLKFKEGTNLKMEGLAAARKVLPEGRELYAQHPYLRGEINGVGLDVVPCYEIKDPSKPVSAVDRTPFHTEWVMENIDGLEDEIRLTKQFLKGAGAYGAGAAIFANRTDNNTSWNYHELLIEQSTFTNNSIYTASGNNGGNGGSGGSGIVIIRYRFQ